MRLKTFRAATLTEAMSQLRTELGPDALILATRRAGVGVEVTAALEDERPTALPDPGRAEVLRWHGVPAALVECLAVGPFEAALAARLRFGALPLDAGSPPLLLVGSPGSGKTLTAVRLATRLVLAGLAPMVISTDVARAGAAAQLEAFTRLLGIPCLVAANGLDLARALARRRGGAPVLIDTGGIDPFDPRAQAGLAGLAACSAATSALVLPAGLDAAESADTAAAFKAAGASHLVPTRLDVVRRIGGVLAAADRGLILTEAGIGPDASDGLEHLSAAGLAVRMLHHRTRKAA